MIKKTQSRATKIILASLLATSFSLPTAASASSLNTNADTAAKIAAANATEERKTVTFQTFKSGTTDLEPGISSHLDSEGIITKKDGKYEAQLTILARSASMITGMQTKQGGHFVDAVEVKNANGTITYHFPVVEGKAIQSKLHVEVPTANMDKWYEYDLVMGELAAEKSPVKVYKDGTTEESVMKDYVEPTVSILRNENKNIVTMTIKKNQEQYIHGFKVAGKEATKAISGGLTTYTFEVADLTKLVNAELHVVVDAAGVKYDTHHKVQFGFDVKSTPEPIVNPFKDIDKDANKAAILELYNKGIVKGAEKFNPYKDLTRSEFALMIARALDLKSTQSAGFKDIVNLKDKERISAINALAEADILKKVDKFNPDNKLTRQEGALMLYRVIKYVNNEEMTFDDISLPFYADRASVKNNESKEAFTLLHTKGIMVGSPTSAGKTVINANSPLKRAHMAKILHGSLELIGK